MKQNNRHYKFSEVLTIINGRNQRKVEDVNGCFPIYGSGGIMGWANDFICPENTIVIGRKGSINNPIFVNQKFWNVDTAFGLVANPSLLLPKYLYYFCVSFNFEALNTTVTIPSLTKANLLNVDIPVPSIKEQEEIVSLLDHLVSLSNTRRIQLQKLDALASSRFVEMFGDPISNPKGWTVKTIRDVVANQKNALKAGPFGSSLKKEFYCSSGYKIYGQEQVIGGSIEIGDYFISKEKYDELKSCAVQAQDVLISLVGTYGKTLVIPEVFYPGIINPRLIKISFDLSVINVKYFQAFFSSEALKGFLDNQTHGCTMGVLNLGIIAALRIPVPPMSLQNEYAAFIEQLDKSKVTIRKNIEKLELLYKALLQEYFG